MVVSAGKSCTGGIWECSDSNEQQQFPVWQVPWACLQHWWPSDGRYVCTHIHYMLHKNNRFCCCEVTLHAGVVDEHIFHSCPPQKPTSRSIYWRSLVWSSREKGRGTSISSTRCLLDSLQRRKPCWSWILPTNTGCTSGLSLTTQFISYSVGLTVFQSVQVSGWVRDCARRCCHSWSWEQVPRNPRLSASHWILQRGVQLYFIIMSAVDAHM